MGFIQKWIHSLNVPVDEATGAIRVTGLQLEGDIDIGDVNILNASDETINPATQEGLASILAKLSADPATQATLAAVLAKLSSDPATQTTLAAVLSALGSPAQTTEADAAADLIITVLGSPSQVGEADSAADLIIAALGSPAQANEADSAADLIITALGSPAQAAEADAAADLIITALGSPAQAGEFATALGSPAQAGEADSAADLIITALGSPMQTGEVDVSGLAQSGEFATALSNASGFDIRALDSTTDAVQVYGYDATGVAQDALQTDGAGNLNVLLNGTNESSGTVEPILTGYGGYLKTKIGNGSGASQEMQVDYSGCAYTRIAAQSGGMSTDLRASSGGGLLLAGYDGGSGVETTLAADGSGNLHALLIGTTGAGFADPILTDGTGKLTVNGLHESKSGTLNSVADLLSNASGGSLLYNGAWMIGIIDLLMDPMMGQSVFKDAWGTSVFDPMSMSVFSAGANGSVFKTWSGTSVFRCSTSGNPGLADIAFNGSAVSNAFTQFAEASATKQAYSLTDFGAECHAFAVTVALNGSTSVDVACFGNTLDAYTDATCFPLLTKDLSTGAEATVHTLTQDGTYCFAFAGKEAKGLQHVAVAVPAEVGGTDATADFTYRGRR